MSMTRAPGEGERQPVLIGPISKAATAATRFQPPLASVFVMLLVYAAAVGLRPVELGWLLVTVGVFLLPAELVRCWASVAALR